MVEGTNQQIKNSNNPRNANINSSWNTVGQNLVVLRHISDITIYFLTSSGLSEWAREQMSTVERASKASSTESANEWAVRANKRMDEQVAQYLCLDSWLF